MGKETPPRQARSRATLERLFVATEALLEEGGVEAATVPAIAERAGVSVGVVYRRFPDKDALLRAVYLRYFGRLLEQNERGFQTLVSLNLPLPVTARALITGMAEGYRRHRNILRPLIRYARAHRDEEFKREAQELNRRTTEAVAKILLADPAAIKHPEPQRAISFGLVTVASLLHELVLEEPLLGMDLPRSLDEELVRMFFGYIGLDP